MRYFGLGLIGMAFLGLIAGCGSGGSTAVEVAAEDPQPEAKEEQLPRLPPMERKPRVDAPQDFSDPQSTVEAFLAALTRRNDVQVEHLLSRKAREEAATHGQRIGALGSPTARFEVTRVEAASANESEVLCTYRDQDDQGSPVSFAVSYLVRQEEGHWRVTGMKAPIPGSATMIEFNFEDFAAMEASQRLAETEMRNRAAEATAANAGSKR